MGHSPGAVPSSSAKKMPTPVTFSEQEVGGHSSIGASQPPEETDWERGRIVLNSGVLHISENMVKARDSVL